MGKAILVYWSSTGNTQAMAEAIGKGVQGAGVELTSYQVSAISADEVAGFDKILLGCPAMGAEELEEAEFEPFFSRLEATLAGKKLALFGSYGWGDGEWMRNWQDRAIAAGAELFEEGLMLQDAPDDAGLAECEAFGRRFAQA